MPPKTGEEFDGPAVTEDPFVRQSPLADTKERELDTRKARQGVAFGEMRYVLGISLALVILAGIVLWIVFVT